MPSVSKRDFHSWISAWALDRALRESDFLMFSFSSFSLKFSRSVAIILYLVRREERSLLSALARDLVSSSWVDTEILPLFMLAIAASSSSIWRERSWFSTCSLFLEDSASLRARAISSSLVLASTMLPWSSFPDLSSSALPLTASSKSQRASRRSSSMLDLSFSDFTLLLLRPSICSPRSAIVLLCFIRRAARVPSWAMFSSSSSDLRRANSPSRFLFSSTWVAVLEPASSSLEAMSSMSFFSMVRLFSALERFPRSTANSSSSSSSLACSSLELALDSFKVRDSLLGQFEVALNLPLGLFNVALDLLLTLKCVLSLVQGLLQLSLDTGQVVALVLGSLDVLLGLLATISTAPLFLAQLGDHVTLVGNLVLKGADLLVFVGSVLLSLGEVTLLDSNLALKLGHCSVGLGHSTLKSHLLGLLILDSGICLVKILLHIGSLIFNPDSFVNHVLNSRATGVQSQLQLVLLSSKAIVDGLDLGTRSNGSVNVGLSLGDLVLVLFLELSELAAPEVGLDGQPQLEPQPM